MSISGVKFLFVVQENVDFIVKRIMFPYRPHFPECLIFLDGGSIHYFSVGTNHIGRIQVTYRLFHILLSGIKFHPTICVRIGFNQTSSNQAIVGLIMNILKSLVS